MHGTIIPDRSRRVPSLRAALVEPRAFSLAPAGWLLRRLRAVGRSLGLIGWTLLAMPIQAVLLRLPGDAKVRFARMFWAGFCRLIGVRRRLVGTPARGLGVGRPVVFVCNHASWLDIAVLGGCLHACFISKDDITRWPLVSSVARLGRTVFVSRQRASTGREMDLMRARLAAGDNLIMFPEGTTSDGAHVLAFRSSFLAIAEGPQAPLLQPVSVVFDRLAGLPARRVSRPVFAYYGATAIGPHFWRLAQWPGMRASVILHPPIDPLTLPGAVPGAPGDRKALAQALWRVVAAGAADLRQNR